MNKLKQKLVALIKEEDGLTTVEYAIAGALVAAGVAASFSTLGTEVKTAIDDLVKCISGNC